MRLNPRQRPVEQAKPEQAERGDAGGKKPPALEQRLQTLVQLERGAAERRLAEVEAALAEAQVRKHEQAEAQRKLARLEEALAEAWSEVKRMTGAIAEANRQAEEARNEIKPRSERRVAEAERAQAEALAKAEQERGLRAEIERRLETVEQSGREARAALEQELTAAQAKDAAEAELRIAELEEMLAQADAEAKWQSGQRTEIEQRLEMPP